MSNNNHGKGEQLFYIQDKRQIVGNCMSFWKEGDNGYSCEIDKAKVFTEREAIELIKQDRGIKYAMFAKELIDSIIVKHARFDNPLLHKEA